MIPKIIGSEIKSLFLIILILLNFNFLWSNQEIEKEVLSDSVIHFYHSNKEKGSSTFFVEFEKFFNVILPSSKPLPFNKSIALLVGISNYDFILSNLPSVKNDIDNMRDFLLNEGGFDDVYIIYDKIVNRDLVEKYIKGIFPSLLKKDDRLLFYFSGHGGDGKGNTGYMQFSKAKPEKFYGNQVLAINDITDWCDEVNIKHMLFILDCCASGLAFTNKSGSTDCDQSILNTLSGTGSRTILTAGTAEQNTYALENRKEHGNGILTKAFLDAFKSKEIENSTCNMITISEIFAFIEKEVANFSIKFRKRITPRLWTLQENDYRGTFVFLNKNKQELSLSSEQASLLEIDLKPKGIIISETGRIQITSYMDGVVYIDQDSIGQIRNGETREYYKNAIGKHKIEIRSAIKTVSEFVIVEKGKISKVVIDPDLTNIFELPNTKNNKLFGSLRLFLDNLGGKVYINDIFVGEYKIGENVLIKKLPVGKSTLTIKSNREKLMKQITIEADKILQQKTSSGGYKKYNKFRGYNTY